MTTTVTAKIQVRKGTAAQWTSANPTLLSGEIGYETDTGKQKMGDGTTAWTSLAYHHDPDLAATYAAIVHAHTGVYEPADADLQAHLISTSNPHSVTAVQVGADASGTAAGLIASHEGAANPHPGYLTPVEGDAAYSALGHAHSGVYDPAGTASSAVSAHAGGSSVHAIASVTGLQTALDGKSATSHDHAATYAPLANGVTNGDSHDHNGGDGGQIAYSTLSGLPTLYAGAASEIHAATAKTTPVDADELGLVDSAASFVLKKLSWANLMVKVKSALAYFKDTNNVSLGSNSFAALTTGTYNTAVGFNALSNNTAGSSNVAIGRQALITNTTGDYNNAIGPTALYYNTSGYNNNAMGNAALLANTTGFDNTGVGNNSLSGNTTGVRNSGIGTLSLSLNSTGYYNVAMGYGAGRFQADGTTPLTDPESSIYIGSLSRGKDNSDDNSIVIGYLAIGLGASTTVIGNASTTRTRLFGNLGLGVDSPSAAIHTIKTTEQLRLGYDASNYLSATVSSTGNLTLDTTGGTIYTPDIIENTTNGEGIILKSPDGTRYKITVANGGTLSVSAV